MMKTFSFIAYVILGIAFEYFLHLLLPGRTIILVPELIIFLAAINLDSKNIFLQFLVSVLLYDFWVGQSLGVISLSMLVMFGALYFSAQISNFSGRKAKYRVFGPDVLVQSLFSLVLFIIYYLCVYYLGILSLKLYDKKLMVSWHLPPSSGILTVMGPATIIFFIFYARLSLRKRSKLSKWRS